MPHITNLTPFQNGTSQRQVRHALLVCTWYFKLSFVLWKTRQWLHNIHIPSSIFLVLGLCQVFIFLCNYWHQWYDVKWIAYYVFRLQDDIILWVVGRCTTTRTILVWVPSFNVSPIFEVWSLVQAIFIAVGKQQVDRRSPILKFYMHPIVLFLSQIESIYVISFPDLLWTKPKARFGKIRFALRDHLSGMWQGRQVRMPNINSEQ